MLNVTAADKNDNSLNNNSKYIVKQKFYLKNTKGSP